ncbi:MAG: hypothetical protein ACRDI1_08030 [Actinomycetota bacterium]
MTEWTNGGDGRKQVDLSEDDDVELVAEGEYAERTIQGAPWRHPGALLAAALFVAGTILAFLTSAAFLLLFIPAMGLSFLSLRGYQAHRPGSARRLVQTGAALVFNGMVLILALFIVGFVHDFLGARTTTVEESVVLAFTTVHIMLGVGLLLLDLRHGRA